MRLCLKYLTAIFLNLLVFIMISTVSFAGETDMFADEPCRNAYMYHFLNRSCYYGDIAGVRILLSTGTDPNGKGYEKYPDCVEPIEFSTPLMMAVSGGHIEIVKLLLEADANPNIIEGEGVTPLVEAVERNDIEMVKLLLKNGAKIELEGMYYKPLDIAKKKGNSDVIKLLRGKD